jgi:spermidine/putrescine transport system ATP-binding protein
MSDRIAVMLDGHVEQLADPDSIYDDPQSAFVAAFIGQNNFLRGRANADGTGLDNDRDAVHVLAARRADDVVTGQPAIAAVRPEAITLTGDDPGTSVNVVAGTLGGTSHLGDVIQFVVLARAGGEIIVRLPRHQAPKLTLGQEVWCTWTPELAHLFSARQAALVMQPDPAAEEVAV